VSVFILVAQGNGYSLQDPMHMFILPCDGAWLALHKSDDQLSTELSYQLSYQHGYQRGYQFSYQFSYQHGLPTACHHTHMRHTSMSCKSMCPAAVLSLPSGACMRCGQEKHTHTHTHTHTHAHTHVCMHVLLCSRQVNTCTPHEGAVPLLYTYQRMVHQHSNSINTDGWVVVNTRQHELQLPNSPIPQPNTTSPQHVN